jgi:hypothetical protein
MANPAQKMDNHSPDFVINASADNFHKFSRFVNVENNDFLLYRPKSAFMLLVCPSCRQMLSSKKKV